MVMCLLSLVSELQSETAGLGKHTLTPLDLVLKPCRELGVFGLALLRTQQTKITTRDSTRSIIIHRTLAMTTQLVGDSLEVEIWGVLLIVSLYLVGMVT